MPLGHVFLTVNVADFVDRIDVLRALKRHAACDWGEVVGEDAELNDEAIWTGGRILSAYFDRNKKRFWIITEADRSSTTVLLPEEY